MEENGKKVLLSLMIVFPTIETWEIKLLFFPIFTLSPIIQKGPIDELLSIFALLEITHVGWITIT